MITEPDLFDWAATARASDPETSHAAGESLDATAISFLQSLVLNALLASPAGLTTHEIADTTRQSLVTISPRMRPLANKGLVVDSGAKRIPPGCTRESIVWKAARRRRATI